MAEVETHPPHQDLPTGSEITAENGSAIALPEESPPTALTIADSENKKVKKIVRKKRRPARPQVDPSTFKSEPPPQTGTIFNIWVSPRMSHTRPH